MKTVCKDFSYKGEHFSIVFDGKWYMSVNHKLIDDAGHPIRTLNYSDGLHPAETFDRCIYELKRDLDIENYISDGYTRAEAISLVLNIPLDIAIALFS